MQRQVEQGDKTGHQIQRVVDGASQTRFCKLDIMVTVKNQVELPVDECEGIGREI